MQLTRALAIAWADKGIRVNTIALGPFRTAPMEEALASGVAGVFVPVGRIGEPEEIGPLAVFLASDASDYLTGQIFIVDGGIMTGKLAPIGYTLSIPLEERR